MAEDRVLMGRVARTHGVRGEICLTPFTESPDFFLDCGHLQVLLPDGTALGLEVDAVRKHKRLVLLKLKGIRSLEEAERLVGAEVFVPRSSLPELEPDEYYWTDLIGLSVFDESGRLLGRVMRILPTGADDLLVLDRDGREILLPFLEEVVQSIDLKAGRVVAAPPPGLLDL
jgi:16S rRNA processing protein RimM